MTEFIELSENQRNLLRELIRIGSDFIEEDWPKDDIDTVKLFLKQVIDAIEIKQKIWDEYITKLGIKK